jgi:hypothetical protein
VTTNVQYVGQVIIEKAFATPDVVNRAYSLADIVLAFLTIEDRAGE